MKHALVGKMLKHEDFCWVVKDLRSDVETPIHPNYFPSDKQEGETMFYEFDTVTIGKDEWTMIEMDVAKPKKP
jgi:hypothetical protein